MILCGSAHSGKSSAAILMIDILTQMQQQQQLQSSSHQQKNLSTSHESNYAQEIAAQTHKLYRINPLAIKSENTLLGHYTLANEWQDGILTTMLRKANRVRINFQFLIYKKNLKFFCLIRIVIQVGFVLMELLVEHGQIYYHQY